MKNDNYQTESTFPSTFNVDSQSF